MPHVSIRMRSGRTGSAIDWAGGISQIHSGLLHQKITEEDHRSLQEPYLLLYFPIVSLLCWIVSSENSAFDAFRKPETFAHGP